MLILFLLMCGDIISVDYITINKKMKPEEFFHFFKIFQPFFTKMVYTIDNHDFDKGDT